MLSERSAIAGVAHWAVLLSVVGEAGTDYCKPTGAASAALETTASRSRVEHRSEERSSPGCRAICLVVSVFLLGSPLFHYKHSPAGKLGIGSRLSAEIL